ncbi:5'-3' exonuclease [Alicyclobacillus acidiphilus]|uniref:5'-3' exonuclease n=1 Tax=Alicyclobacillus acidiphilus TaxID=182455 RepID=UPI0009F887B3|nr:5'-3' exonuclease H3TH domain-containing protein [Alicyclobacillus acidiphilus]
MAKLVIVDGSSILTTSFFGNVPREFYTLKSAGERDALLRRKSLQTSSGIYTNGVLPMTRILMNLLSVQKPTHFAVAWDVSRDTFRRRLYPDYKGHREEALPTLGQQYSTMQSLLSGMKIPQFWFDDYEADDIIGTLSRKFEQDMPVYILTKDQDALQLVTDRTRVWLLTSKAQDMYETRGLKSKQLLVPDGAFEYTPVTFEEEYGLKPLQMIDKKALEGDSSDNIPGVKGVGEKAAIPLLQEFGTIENLYHFIEDMSASEEAEFKSLLKSLGISRSPLSPLLKTSEDELCGKAAAFLSKALATIHTDIEALSSIMERDLRLELDMNGAAEKFSELEFASLLPKLTALAAGDDAVAVDDIAG